jgi:hypothetical protein
MLAEMLSRRSAGEAGAFHHLGEDPYVVEAVHRLSYY